MKFLIDVNVIDKIDSVIKKVWSKDLPIDYDSSFLLKEDSLKNAFYFHLRTRLGDHFLNKHNLRIFTEYYIYGERVDLAIVEIDPAATAESYLGDCVTNVLVAIEMKHKNGYTSNSIFYQDIEKTFNFINTWGSETKHYFAFIQEKYFAPEEIENWIGKESASEIKEKVTELYAYWNVKSNETVWSIVDY